MEFLSGHLPAATSVHPSGPRSDHFPSVPCAGRVRTRGAAARRPWPRPQSCRPVWLGSAAASPSQPSRPPGATTTRPALLVPGAFALRAHPLGGTKSLYTQCKGHKKHFSVTSRHRASEGEARPATPAVTPRGRGTCCARLSALPHQALLRHIRDALSCPRMQDPPR